MERDRERCLEAGMDDDVTKPVRREALEAALKKWTAPAEPSPASAATPTTTDHELVENLRWMREEGGDEFVAELVASFLKKAPPLISALAEALATANSRQVGWVVHDLKGMSASLGATKLAEALRDLERKTHHGAIEGGSLDSIRQEFARLELLLAEPSHAGGVH
jgi:two-component system, sensor histidine kinase and response regulator